jgi:hypothetical protein
MTEQNVAQNELSPTEQKPEILAGQQETNHAEWLKADNWGGPKTLAVYFSKKDNRVWVPQQKPSIGWTLNLAHTGGVVWLVGICVGIILVMVAVSIFVGDLLVRYFNAQI